MSQCRLDDHLCALYVLLLAAVQRVIHTSSYFHIFIDVWSSAHLQVCLLALKIAPSLWLCAALHQSKSVFVHSNDAVLLLASERVGSLNTDLLYTRFLLSCIQ